VRGDADIVLDRAFALKMDIAVGDTVSINDMPLRVCGLSGGTNAFVLQYAFVTLRRARLIAGIPDLVSLYLLRITPGTGAARVAREIERDIPGTAAFTREVFLANNLKEMEAGFLPLLFAIAGLGMVVMTVILSLLLGITILERRKDFAMMKTLGAPRGYLPGSIAVQALLLAALGTAAGVAVFPALMFAVESLSPEISTVSSPAQVLLVVAVCLLVSQGSALVSMRRLRGIYALEVYQ
jgi:putative ABC transport system permease protein